MGKRNTSFFRIGMCPCVHACANACGVRDVFQKRDLGASYASVCACVCALFLFFPGKKTHLTRRPRSLVGGIRNHRSHPLALVQRVGRLRARPRAAARHLGTLGVLGGGCLPGAVFLLVPVLRFLE